MSGFRRTALAVCAVLFLLALSRDRLQSRLAGVLRVPRLLVARPDASLAMPVKGVSVRRVASTWGAPRIGHRHQGEDIFAKRGTPVLSATEGIVMRTSTTGLGGNAVSVLGAGGRMYYYAHLSGFAQGIAEGQPVTRDSILGYVGNTGNARTTPPHLHFGMYGPAGAIDPLPLMVDRNSSGD